MIAAADSCEHVAEALRRSWDVWDVDFRIGYSVDGTIIARGMDERGFEELRDRLAQQPGTPLGDRGDEYVILDKQLLIKIAGDDVTSEVEHVVEGYGSPPEMLVPLIHTFARSFAMLWHKTRAREPVSS